MHDGTSPYEGAVECMLQLAKMGKKVVLISNSSKRVGTSMKKLDKMGFDSAAVRNQIISARQRRPSMSSDFGTAP